MNHLKDKKPTRPDIQEILSRMKSRFINERDSDSDEHTKEENVVTTIVMNTVKEEIPVEKSPDDEIAELMLQLNGQVDEELVASIRSRKKMYENHSEVDSTSTTINSDEIEQEKPRIILTLRPNENKPDSYVSSSNLTDFGSNSPKKKKPTNDVSNETVTLKRSSRRSNDSNQSVLKSAIARKERTFSIDENSKKKLPKKVKKEHEEITNEVNTIPVNTQKTIENEDRDDIDVKIKEERNDENITDHKKKKKKFFRGGRYNIFKKKSLQKERQRTIKKAVFSQINSDSGNFDVDSSETNSERHSTSVCSDIGTLLSSDKNDQDDMDTTVSCISTTDAEDKVNYDALNSLNIKDKEVNYCLCNESIQVVIVDEGKITCKAEDCIDGKLIPCKRLAFHLDQYGNMPMLRANVTLPFLTFCEHHTKRFFLHHSCSRCGRFCSEGIFMMCKNKHFSHIGCHQKDKGCLHCGVMDVYDLELKRHVIKPKKTRLRNEENIPDVSVSIGNIKLSTLDCPQEIDVHELSKYLQQLKEEIVNPKRTMYSVLGLNEACEKNDIKKVLSILGAECSISYTFPSNHNRTALHVACSKGHFMLVYLLLQAGADPNQVDNKMKSPIRMAAKNGHKDVVQYLMAFNGAPEIKDIQGMTSLHLAAKNGKLECCKIILNRHSSMVNWKDNGGWTPLVWACENSHIDVVEFFITHKPNTRVPDDENNVALHWAAISGCLGVVKCLVEYDPEVNMLNDAGDTALHIAARKNALEIVSYLLEKGAMAWHRNKAKKRPIDCCLPNSKCYSVLKNVPFRQRKPVTTIQPLITAVNVECTEPEVDTIKNPVFVKSTPVLISEDITHGCEDVPIRCVNEIDDEVPCEFTYIKENCYDVGNYVDSAMSHIASCSCEGACNTSDCKCVQANGDCVYDENGRLKPDFDYFSPSVIIYECNWRCRCHKQKCGNRVIQKGIKVNLELYKHKDMGWGVKTRQDISRGTFVCEYVGEIITDQKANDLKEDSYLFNLENPGADELYCIDAYNYSNVSRFINHSCDPNLMSVRSFINHHDQRFPRIAFFAVQDIKQNEQLSYDYGTTFWKVKGGLFTCKCGKANCSFSEETINSLHIDSDTEEVEIEGNAEQNVTEHKEMSNKDLIDSNEMDKNVSHHNTRISKNDNLFEQDNVHSCSSSSESPSTSPNNSKASSCSPKQRNGLRTKNKSVGPKVIKKNCKNGSKNELKVTDTHASKLIQNKLNQVTLKKRSAEKILNGNSNSTNGRPLLNTSVTNKKKSSVQISEKNKMCNGNKMSQMVSVQSMNYKTVKSYELRTKVSNSDKKNSENTKTKDTVSHDIILRSSDIRNNREISILSDTSSCNQNTTKDTNDCCELVDNIKIEPDDEESDAELIILNGDYTSAETSYTTSSRDSDKVKPGEIFDIKKSYKKDCFSCSDQNNLSSIDVIK